MVVLYIRDHGIFSKNIDQKPASQYLHGAMAVLVSPKVPSVQPEMLPIGCSIIFFSEIFY